MEKEIFVDVIGFEGLYEVSNYGRFKNKKFNKILNGTITKKGYLMVSLKKDDMAYIKRSHRLVYYSFYPNDCNKKQINHIDRNKINNALSNLEAVSSRENNSHKNLFIKKTSKYIGVSWASTRKAWRASITINGKRKFLGHFDKEIDARNAYLTILYKNNLTNKYAL